MPSYKILFWPFNIIVSPIDMPDLISKLIFKKYKVKAFYVFENWLDVGTKKTLSMARKKLQNNSR